MKKMNKVLSILLVLTMCIMSLAACGKKTKTDDQTPTKAPEATAAPTDAAGEEPGAGETEENTTPLVVGYDAFSEKFSPFFADTVMDQDVANVTGVSLLTTDRGGAIIFNAIEGETVAYNGTDYTYNGIADLDINIDTAADTTTYYIKIRDDVKFSDGEVMDADDIIFTYYVLSDPSYDGSSTLYSQPIIGMKNYRANSSAADTITTEDVNKMLAEPNDDLKQQFADKLVRPLLEEEYEWCGTLYGNESYKKYTDAYPEQKDLFASFYSIDENYDSSAVADAKQVVEDVIAQYGSDYKTLAANYGDAAYLDADAAALATTALVEAKKAAGEGSDVANIEGIKKLSNTEVQVTTKGYDATAVYQIAGIIVAPLHYYGDVSQYDYENNKFGFPRGDLSIVKGKTTKPLGAGPFKYVKYENKVVFFEANENYYQGAPKTKYMQWKETNSADKVTGIEQGTIDISNPSGSKTVFEQIAEMNSNGELSGDKIVTNRVDNRGYGYIGMNADRVNVGGEPASEASKNLRKALSTVLSVYRDVAIDTYYGDAASIINYPISNTSWAAPQKSDADYAVAFSKDVNGNPIYTASMSSEDKYAAALKAALGYFEAAGYTVSNGMVTAAPAGAKMEYTVMIPGDGEGDHPSFAILTDAAAALKSIGFTLTVDDLADSAVLWERMDAAQQELWCAAWQATIDPDMYQVYHSTNAVGKGGTDSNHYHIADSDLDTLIMDARKSDDQTYRKAAYKQCLDIVMDWAVEIPVYQRQNCIVFSGERVNMDTVTPDVTTWYDWIAEIYTIELK
ncbi:peptide/nickel transport system substrate-binding protein [Anaerotaenia torta]|uniref:ABC transporter substrate-binding protein n=1 Tax=Anaerotaenia torta TaxID=433293 RepID=UPI003D1AF99C